VPVRKILVLALVLAAVATASVAVPAMSSPTATSAATTTVKIGDNYFVRPSGVPVVTISKGSKVRWVWKGRRTHNVSATRGPHKFDSPIKDSGSYTRTFKTRGTYKIICTIHGASDQSMKLVVK
jgi:plastocyanin